MWVIYSTRKLGQVIYNNPEYVSYVRQELKSLNKLEIALISQQLLFKKNNYHGKRKNA